MAIEGMKVRGRVIKDLSSIAVEHRVKKVGATLAAVVLWEREEKESFE
jgi:pyruvoyl-dependent arginine decarboxylase (PvlArgDC)